jgi:peptidoglycan hydrolase-like protein with peptidoglycan-binding domain
VLGIVLILLAATSSNGQTGGTSSPTAKPVAVSPQGPAPELGQRVLGRGSSGSDVETLQSILRARGFGQVQASGQFDDTTDAAVRSFQRDAGLAVDGLVGPRTRPALVRLMRVLNASWYGPGFYGRRTACGTKLQPRTLGVASRTLPCGTPVTFYHGGHFVTVAVIDRGPFNSRLAWDLTAETARRLGIKATGRLRSLP